MKFFSLNCKWQNVWFTVNPLLQFGFYWTVSQLLLFMAIAYDILDVFSSATLGFAFGMVFAFAVFYFSLYRPMRRDSYRLIDKSIMLLDRSMNRAEGGSSGTVDGDEWKRN